MLTDVVYFFTHDKIVTIVTGENRKYPADYTLDQLEKMLDPKLFFRINRQFIVSSKAIREMYVISKSRVKINLHPPTEMETAVSSERVANFKKWLTEESRWLIYRLHPLIVPIQEVWFFNHKTDQHLWRRVKVVFIPTIYRNF